jgi:hypothetical protein
MNYNRLKPLLSNPQAWAALEEYLKHQQTVVFKALTVAQSESELRQLQGKAALLEMLLFLNNQYNKDNNGNK